MYILGINSFHGDSSACLIKDGILLAAVEEERFRRIKHWAGFPSESIRYCLSVAGVPLSDISYIAINQNPNVNFGRKLLFLLSKKPNLKFILDRINNKIKRASIEKLLSKEFIGEKVFSGKVFWADHHRAHLSSAFHVSPFNKSVVVSIDGFGDFASTTWGLGHGVDIKVDGQIYFPHSLGIFYQALTQYLGFYKYGDEYKVMGLAPYGQPKYLADMHKILRIFEDGTFRLDLDYFTHHNKKIIFEWDGSEPKISKLFSIKLEELLGPSRVGEEPLTQFHKDIASSIQEMYQIAFFNLLNFLYKKYQINTLCLAGGCAMNSVANGKVLTHTPFKNLYIQSAAGDAGGAIGAAYLTWHKFGGQLGKVRSQVHDHAYWGPEYSDSEIGMVLTEYRDKLLSNECTILHVDNFDNLCEEIANLLAKRNIIGWFQGRLEWGPRALGNRSILGDPRQSNMKEVLNEKIKRRESFRPFAPSILRESVSEWFEQEDDVPFMMQVYQIRKEKRKEIPAVTHVDGSGRLQTVCEKTNPKYHKLISKFYKLTGVPLLLNTSFNENEPVVCKPEEALNCFLRTNMDVLVMGGWIIKRTICDEKY